MKIRILFFMAILCLGCSKSKPRRPINPKASTTILKEIVEESIALNKTENAKILQSIAKDSLTKYHISPNGFWYTYKHKIEENLPSPKAGSEVELSYNITALNDSILYSTADLGIKKYKVDKEDFISALQHGIKLMKTGETITFVIPSYNAFGISGDGNKIGINQTIKSTVTLININ